MASGKLAPLLANRPDLNWFSPSAHDFSDELAFEAILNYGEWDDIQRAIKTIGFKQAKKIFLSLSNKRRLNLRPEINHYFTLYFNYYDS